MTSGLSPSARSLDVGFAGAQAVPSSTSPVDPLSRKPHPSPGLQTGDLCQCLVSKPRLTSRTYWTGLLPSLTGSSHLACPGRAVCPFLPFLYFSQFPTQNLNSEAAPCSLPTPPLQHTHTHTHTHTTHNFIPLRNHTLFLYQLIQGHIATEYSIPGTERLQLSPPYPKAPLTSTSLALLSFHHASLPPKLTTLPLP